MIIVWIGISVFCLITLAFIVETAPEVKEVEFWEVEEEELEVIDNQGLVGLW